VGAADPFAIAVGVSTMIAVAAVAAFLPARKASSMDPMIALRHE